MPDYLMVPLLIIVGYALGASFTTAFMAGHGARNPHTFDDCFSGDSFIDMMLVVFWPISLPLIVICMFGAWIGRLVSRVI